VGDADGEVEGNEEGIIDGLTVGANEGAAVLQTPLKPSGAKVQKFDSQSSGNRQPKPASQGEQGPPQSMSVSSPLKTPSLQDCSDGACEGPADD